MKRASIIAIARDGGSKLIEYDGKQYFLDYGIASETRGQLFHGTSRDGKKVEQELANKIKASLE